MFTKNTTTNFLNQLIGRNNTGLGGTVYLALSATVPNVEGGGITEPVGNGYARALIGQYNGSVFKMSAPVYDSSTGQTYTINTEEIHFDEATGSWGTLTHFAIYSSKTGGAALYVGELTSPITPSTNNVVIIRVGDLKITLE